jgi:putative transposase
MPCGYVWKRATETVNVLATAGGVYRAKHTRGVQVTQNAAGSRKHRGGSLRLPSHDYSQAGAYAVTIRTRPGQPLFGEVVDGEMHLSIYGQIAQHCCEEIPLHFDHARIDTYLVMPDHLHAIVILVDECPGHANGIAQHQEAFGRPAHGSRPTVIRSLKSAVSKAINELRRTPGESVWQRGYYEHVIRDGRELNEQRRYILENPLRWSLDHDV